MVKEQQSDLERNFLILFYLRKNFGQWINRNIIGTRSTGRVLHRKRLDESLDNLQERGFIEKRDAENPQAKYEFKLTESGKIFVDKYLALFKDPDLRNLANIKEEKRFEEI